jgi:hypothetical protein
VDCKVVVTGQPENAELFRMRNAQGDEEELVRKREDGGVGSDGESQGASGDESKGWILTQDTDGVPEVGSKFVEPAQTERTSNIGTMAVGRTKLDASLARRLNRAEALMNEVFSS